MPPSSSRWSRARERKVEREIVIRERRGSSAVTQPPCLLTAAESPIPVAIPAPWSHRRHHHELHIIAVRSTSRCRGRSFCRRRGSSRRERRNRELEEPLSLPLLPRRCHRDRGWSLPSSCVPLMVVNQTLPLMLEKNTGVAVLVPIPPFLKLSATLLLNFCYN
ncbi:uncharacterized protein LOC107622054 isoform X2 [Arachis ipaensis]|uniref:uncharacterized protein LOC107622054 isoform X2 n=1 Tax=Arachis ipaensis TaxID=130454 RepID=UPI000A2B900E|nr:uncharacterized protein LOC107622054 isoform X2 [Arachis ipaensis]XP_029152216.1 uncharacterized protein LOC112785889 isoform X2 [Arachis hypogaea]